MPKTHHIKQQKHSHRKNKIFKMFLLSLNAILFQQIIYFSEMKCPEVIKAPEEMRRKSVCIQLLSLKGILFLQFIAFQCHHHCHFYGRNF